MGIPLIFALGTAERSNYSSARLDLQTFFLEMEVQRMQITERECLDRLLEAWLDEAMLIDGFLPRIFLESMSDLEWYWMWAGRPMIDRAKEASGAQTELAQHLTTLSREYARQGLDWEVELRQRAKELQMMRDSISPANKRHRRSHHPTRSLMMKLTKHSTTKR